MIYASFWVISFLFSYQFEGPPERADVEAGGYGRRGGARPGGEEAGGQDPAAGVEVRAGAVDQDPAGGHHHEAEGAGGGPDAGPGERPRPRADGPGGPEAGSASAEGRPGRVRHSAGENKNHELVNFFSPFFQTVE